MGVKSRGKVNGERRDLLRWLYDGACFWCHFPLGADCTLDELTPRAHGGGRVLENQVPAHSRCNNERGSSLPARWALNRHKDVLQAHAAVLWRSDQWRWSHWST